MGDASLAKMPKSCTYLLLMPLSMEVLVFPHKRGLGIGMTPFLSLGCIPYSVVLVKVYYLQNWLTELKIG